MASNLRVDNIQPSTGTGIGIGTANGSVTIAGDLSVDTSKGLTVGTGATIFSPSSNVLTLGTNNAERVKINSNGTVVVRGPSNPADYTLSNGIFVQPGNGLSALTIASGSATDNAWINFSKGTASHTEQFGFAIGRDGTNNQGVVLVDNAVTARFGSTGIVMPSGKGIDFSANSNAAGMTSELLDDYEEGTWTPTQGNLSTWTSPTFNATYTKIGRLVQVNLQQTGGTIGWSAQEYIGGLPFAPAYPGSAYATDNYPDSDNGPLLIWTSSNIYFHTANASEAGLIFTAIYHTS